MKKFIVSFIIFLLLISCSSFENGNEITQGLYFFPDGLDPAKNTIILLPHRIAPIPTHSPLTAHSEPISQVRSPTAQLYF